MAKVAFQSRPHYDSASKNTRLGSHAPPAGDLPHPATTLSKHLLFVDGSLVPPGQALCPGKIITYQLVERLQYFTWYAPTDEVQLNTSPGPWIYIRTLLECLELGEEPETLQTQALYRNKLT